VRYILTRSQPDALRILLIESGSRHLYEGLIPGIRTAYGDSVNVDLVTCYAGLPRGFSAETTRVYRVSDYRGSAGRKQLYRELAANRYSIAGMICSGEPIMTKWKWALALQVPAKIFIVNENADYFWLDFAHRRVLTHFAFLRSGFTGIGGVRTLARLIAFPFTLAWLLAYAAWVHSRRALRLLVHAPR
jgi:hypothetical protein